MRTALLVMTFALVGTPAMAVTRATRAPALGAPVSVAQTMLFGGAIKAELVFHDVSDARPPAINGQSVDGAADVQLRVYLQAAAAPVLGFQVLGEHVPYQRLHVRIENLSTSSTDRTIELDLIPHVGRDGWYYASNVLLPPESSTGNPLQELYRVTVTLEPSPLLVLYEDALPASPLWRASDPSTLFSVDTRVGAITQLPVADPAEAQTHWQSATDLRTALLANNFTAALGAYVGGDPSSLQTLFRALEDASVYAPAHKLTAASLADLDDTMTAALNRADIAGDCGAGRDSECLAWAEVYLLRGLVLASLRSTDVAVAGEGDAQDAWSRAWAYAQGPRDVVAGFELECAGGPPRAPRIDDCTLIGRLDGALLDGANAIARSDDAALRDAASRFERVMVKGLYFGLVTRLWRAVEGGADHQAHRAAARAYANALGHLLNLADRNAIAATLGVRDAAPSESAARDIVTRLNANLSPGFLAASETVNPDDMLEVLP